MIYSTRQRPRYRWARVLLALQSLYRQDTSLGFCVQVGEFVLIAGQAANQFGHQQNQDHTGHKDGGDTARGKRHHLWEGDKCIITMKPV